MSTKDLSFGRMCDKTYTCEYLPLVRLNEKIGSLNFAVNLKTCNA